MNALERKLSNMLYEFKKENGTYPKFVSCKIRWHNDKEYVGNMVFATYAYDCDNEDDDRIFFYLDKPDYLYSLLANIDFLQDDFDSVDEFYEEVDKYDTDDDYSILHNGDDFCIVDIDDMFDEF